MSSDCKVVHNELQDVTAKINLQVENCQLAISTNSNQLDSQNKEIQTLKTENLQLSSRTSILEADYTNLENKIQQLQSVLNAITEIEKNVSLLIKREGKKVTT